jgi:hypothetical protein
MFTIDEIVRRSSNPKVEPLITEVYEKGVERAIFSTLGFRRIRSSKLL